MKYVLPSVVFFVTIQSIASADSVVANLVVRPGWNVSPDQQMIAFDVTLSPGWKTYWRAPGDAGIPARFELDAQSMVQNVEIKWPTPEIFNDSGLRSIGYLDRAILPAKVSWNNSDQGTRDGVLISGVATIGVCKDICVPVELPFSQMLYPETKRDPQIIAALLDQPAKADDLGLESPNCEMSRLDHNGIELSVVLPQGYFEVPYNEAIETSQSDIWVSQPSFEVTGSDVRATVKMFQAEGDIFDVALENLRTTLFNPSQVVEFTGCALQE